MSVFVAKCHQAICDLQSLLIVYLNTNFNLVVLYVRASFNASYFGLIMVCFASVLLLLQLFLWKIQTGSICMYTLCQIYPVCYSGSLLVCMCTEGVNFYYLGAYFS